MTVTRTALTMTENAVESKLFQCTSVRNKFNFVLTIIFYDIL